MTDSDISGPQLSHMDDAAQHLSSTESDGDTSVDISYTQNPDKEDLGSVENRGADIDLTSSVADSDELINRRHLEAHLAAANSPDQPFRVSNGDMDPAQAAARFDQSVLDLYQWGLQAEGGSDGSLLNEETVVEEKYIKAILLHDAWQWDSWHKVELHLRKHSEIADRMGFRSIPEGPVFWKQAETLKKHGWRQAIRNAAVRIVHAVFRYVRPLPDVVVDGHGLDSSIDVADDNTTPRINENAIPRGTRRQAILNWCDELLEPLVDQLTFERDGNVEVSKKQIVGLLAQAAYSHGVTASKPTAGWHYADDDLPDPTHVTRVIRALDHGEIRRMFAAVTRVFVRQATEYGFFDDEVAYDYALDTTWITWWGEQDAAEDSNARINNPRECATGEGWCFGAVLAMPREARFAIGVDLVWHKNETIAQFRRLLRLAGKTNNVGRLHADREFESEQAVRLCRAIAGENWVIRVRNKSRGEIGKEIDNTPPGGTNFKKDVEFADLKHKPNLYVYPVPDSYSSDTDHFAFLTDLQKDDIDLRGMFTTYSKRWTIEEYFKQLKHGFCPSSETPSDELRLFLMNIATLFYNLHTLMNRAPSPQYGLRLNVRYYEVLQGIVETVFRRSDPTEVDVGE